MDTEEPFEVNRHKKLGKNDIDTNWYLISMFGPDLLRCCFGSIYWVKLGRTMSCYEREIRIKNLI